MVSGNSNQSTFKTAPAGYAGIESMAKKINYIEASKTDWEKTVTDNASNFPGIDYMGMACLQRIATATEAMAKNHTQLIADRDLYKRWYEGEKAANARLNRANAALRGIINRMKKEVWNG